MQNIGNKTKITVCYFGIYNPSYSRNRIFIKGLRQNGAEVIECATVLKGILKYFDLIKKHWKIRKQYDVLVVGYPGQQSVILARFLTKKPIIFDALVSLYDSMVNDREVIRRGGVKAVYYFILDWLASTLANKVIFDTNAHVDYFVKIFHLNRNKLKRIFIGSDDDVLYPMLREDKDGDFFIHFHGCFNPLQGVEYIIKAAKILEKENIKFDIIGTGQKTAEMKELTKKLRVKNITFIDYIPYETLKDSIAKASVSLGVFGNTEKATRVIPNKVYEALAARSSIITGRTPAVIELLTDRKNVLLCNMADAVDLANKILELKNNNELRESIAKQGYDLFKSKLTPRMASAELLILIKDLMPFDPTTLVGIKSL